MFVLAKLQSTFFHFPLSWKRRRRGGELIKVYIAFDWYISNKKAGSNSICSICLRQTVELPIQIASHFFTWDSHQTCIRCVPKPQKHWICRYIFRKSQDLWCSQIPNIDVQYRLFLSYSFINWFFFRIFLGFTSFFFAFSSFPSVISLLSLRFSPFHLNLSSFSLPFDFISYIAPHHQGPVSFNGADRIGISAFNQVQGGSLRSVALYHPAQLQLDFECPKCVPIKWKGNQVPIAKRIFKLRVATIAPIAFFIISALSLVGIILSIAFLTFNLHYRKMK